MRQHLFAANWKMYKTPDEATAFIRTFATLLPPDTQARVVLFPPTIDLPASVEAARPDRIPIGAQNMHWLDSGAYTGETSPTMLLAIGVQYVLIGHSERRQYFNETDETVNLKLKAALAHSLIPIVCVGEHLQEREADQTSDVLNRQVAAALKDIEPADAASLILAYEPVWAIGTGRTATPQIAEDAHKIIRKAIAEALGEDLASATPILYGGSVKPENAASLCCLGDVDGALVGGASLDPEIFTQIIKNASRD